MLLFVISVLISVLFSFYCFDFFSAEYRNGIVSSGDL